MTGENRYFYKEDNKSDWNTLDIRYLRASSIESKWKVFQAAIKSYPTFFELHFSILLFFLFFFFLLCVAMGYAKGITSHTNLLAPWKHFTVSQQWPGGSTRPKINKCKFSTRLYRKKVERKRCADSNCALRRVPNKSLKGFRNWISRHGSLLLGPPVWDFFLWIRHHRLVIYLPRLRAMRREIITSHQTFEYAADIECKVSAAPLRRLLLVT